MEKLHCLPSELDKEDHWKLMEFLEIDALVSRARARQQESNRRYAERQS